MLRGAASRSGRSVVWAGVLGGWLMALVPALLTAEELRYPLSVAANAEGALFIADRNQRCLWKATEGKLEILFQASPKLRTPLNVPLCVAVDGKGRVLAGDSSTREVYRVEENGELKPLTNGGIGIPISIAFGSRGEILVSDLELMRIVKISVLGAMPEEVGKVQGPRGIAVDGQGKVCAVSHGPNQVVRLHSDGRSEPIVRGRPFQFPNAIAFDLEGNLYVSDGYAATIWKVNTKGEQQKWASGEPLKNPVGLFWQKDRLVVADPHIPAILEVTAEGKVSPLDLK